MKLSKSDTPHCPDHKEFYPSPNPLIRLQLERIAKINIQLERIQNTIDAQFVRTRVLSRGYHELASYLDMDRETKSLALNVAMGLGGKEKMLDLKNLQLALSSIIGLTMRGHQPMKNF